MYSLLLKKTLPFALTFVVGSLIGGLFHSFGVGGREPRPAHAYFYGYGEGHGRSCRMRARQRYLVAETKPLAIIFKPDAMLPAGTGALALVPDSVTPIVTFGADGRVQGVEPQQLVGCAAAIASIKDAEAAARGNKLVWDAVERAARQIQFEPEMENGLPVTVVKDVEIRVTFN
jgi:hypothetical protein